MSVKRNKRGVPEPERTVKIVRIDADSIDDTFEYVATCEHRGCVAMVRDPDALDGGWLAMCREHGIALLASADQGDLRDNRGAFDEFNDDPEPSLENDRR